MKKLVYISGIVLLNLFAFGSIFKVIHWPGANIMFMGGLGLFALLFLPLAVVHSYRDNGRKNATLYFAGFFCAFFCIISALFKVLHWPGASIMLAVSIPLPFVYFLPVYIYNHSKSKEKSFMNFIGIMLLMVFIAVYNSMLALDVSKEILNAMAVGEKEISETTEILKDKNDNAYESVTKNADSEKKAKIFNLKERSAELSAHIELIKNELIENVGGEIRAANMKKGQKNLPVTIITESLITSSVMRGQDETGGKAEELKKALTEYSSFMKSTMADDSVTLTRINSLLNVSDNEAVNNENNQTSNWENSFFQSGTYFIVVLGNLELIENNVKIAEAVAINSLMNKQ
jgi:hypothetical protein